MGRGMTLFLDCEFTQFERPALISIGLVDASGERCFYGVVEDFNRGHAATSCTKPCFLSSTPDFRCARRPLAGSSGWRK